MIERTYTVVGMACGHCADLVSEELEGVDGVLSVSVEVELDRVTVSSEREPGFAEVRAAVEEAGYELAGPLDAPGFGRPGHPDTGATGTSND
ncbi:heavy-metal-associated domain-containing protein [Nocardiopsis sp. B62]|uniref:heavy-metal-associated domain-containing protein n=1 Tax=Nocardiopsis sp. B62 TaxID=2824874 RepID=UPI001B3803BB|nr:heavy-metal-associated domain-containing protein [Nocardiopsis sp. B62]MBQ1082843.1 heavy-metal-associated domain-containing protein [Nocardiopsis sp. B62]